MLSKIRHKAAAIFCAAFRHSRIATFFFGYQYCARCGAQIGDSLGGVGRRDLVSGDSFPSCSVLERGDRCESCEENLRALTWKDRFMAPKPWMERNR